MKWHYELMELPMEFPFRISRSTQTLARTVRVEIESPEGPERSGLGEAVPSEFYGETPESVMAFYERLQQERFLEEPSWWNIQDLEERLSCYRGNRAAKAGLEMAFHDLRGKEWGAPLYQVWGVDPTRLPKTSYTIGIDDEATVRQKLELALDRGFDVLKIKLGGPRDLETVALIREEAPEATLRVDANAGWSLPEAVDKSKALEAYGVEFIEAPLPVGATDDDYHRLRRATAIPLMADEDCLTLQDIPRCVRLFDAINLKHTKTGGLEEARRMIHAARAHGIRVMLGGFAESSISVTALAHLGPLVDYCDLDACLLVAEDPYEGLQFDGSRIALPTRSGIGVRRRSPRP